MFPTDQATAATALPTPATAGTTGYFTNGNPATGVAATIVDADWLNMIQQELLNIVAAGGITPSKTTYNQVLAAIKRVNQSTTILTDTGTANAYAAANAVPLVSGSSPTWVDGVVQSVKIAHANTGPSTYSPDTLTAIPIYGLGLLPLQGSELVVGGTAILMRSTIAGVNSGNPICILMECAGGAQQVALATASYHAPQFGQVNAGRLLNVQTFTASGTYTPTTGTNKVVVEVQGGGGGGGGCAANASGFSSVGASGGSGAYAKVLLTSGFSGATVTIGAAGAAGASAAAGGQGGTTSFGSVISCPGGLGGGILATANSPGFGLNVTAQSAPTVSSGTTIALGAGQSGCVSISGFNSGAGSSGGAGAPSLFGAGGTPTATTSTAVSGRAGTGNGSGGSGGCSGSSGAATTGGAGTSGIVVIWEYA